jgi:hypothetical protein
LASLKTRLQSAEDEITTIKTEIASLDTTLQGDLIMSDAAATLTHSAATGGMTINSTNGYVDVEQVRFTDKNIGISADADLITLASTQVTIGGTLKLDSTGDLEVAKALTSITHTGGTGMAISSTTGYVDIESIRFGGNVMGPTGDPNLVTLASGALNITGKLSTTGNTAVLGTLGVTGAAMLSSSLAVNSDFTVATNKFKVTASDGSLAITTDKFTVAGGSGNTLIAGTLGVTGSTTMASTLGVTGATTMASTLGVTGATTIASNTAVGGTLAVAGASILTGAATLQSTLSVTGNTAIEGTLSVDGAVTVAGKLIQTPPICLSPGGRLAYNGTHYACVCMLKYSGVQCEVPPSISRTESTSETIVPGVEAISDSGNADGNCIDYGSAGGNCDYSKILDGDVDMCWQATSDENVFVVFDMKREVSITSFAVYPHRTYTYADYFGPESFKLESGTAATGPWTSVFSLGSANPTGSWRHHIISPVSSKARY